MTRESFCHNADGTPKGAFLQKREAKRVARMVATRSAYDKPERVIHLYKCPDCRLYHIGHQSWNGGPDAA